MSERCHVCGSRIGVRKPRPDVPPTCPRNECTLAAAGMISVMVARRRLRDRTRREAVDIGLFQPDAAKTPMRRVR